MDLHLALEMVISPLYLHLLLIGEPLEEPIIEQIVDLVLDGTRALMNAPLPHLDYALWFLPSGFL